jgi:hypothetical protein
MALVVEDGSHVPDANTFVDRDTLIAYALARGVVIPNDDSADVLLTKAMDYLQSLEDNFAGVPSYTDELVFPRIGIYGLGPDIIPRNVRTAQLELALQVKSGVKLLPTTGAITEDAFIKREKVDVIETEYSEAVALAQLSFTVPYLPYIDSLLAKYMRQGSQLRAHRI